MTTITKTNFKNVLKILSFIENGSAFEKKFSAFNCSLGVDFANEKLIYPVEIKGRERNDDFKQPENFVVFECVNRLLEKGYRPEHIELEKEWHLGHDAKGGRADICVSSPDGSMLFIVECKTAGREFDKAYKDTCVDGGQLFSYWQQERATKWLVLYASGIDGDTITYKAPTINCTDDPNIVIGAKKDSTIKLYTSAYTAEEKHLVWRDTYASSWFDDLVFSTDSRAYEIGIKPLFKKDLRDFTPDDKIVNKFEEILRHNNVSDKENAFNRLVALFICKLVDEIQKSDADEVEFQYKQGTDTYETLQDRLQRLHKEGMETFMREEIFYVSADYPEWLFSNYTGHQRKKAIEDLKDKIRILKFFSNNDFSFKDVHNEELFYQNGKILVEVVQLFEKYRIVYPSKHQFLGDLFEQLLNKGFKQNEGQFFTPMPITRFIWDCLPVEQITHSEKGTIYPKIIDYACGAGHFLTEAVEAINAFVESDGDNSWVRDHIFGIEKDYRLARVAKISLYMNGAGEGNIIFGDGLENLPERQIENGTFDILVANPPYSVKDFKQHLKLKNNSFELLERIGDNGSEIETLFVERIAQLLKPKGIAAVVLPSSILSNDSASYTGAREHIMQNFLIRAIVQLGSVTFGETGTNTVVLFLEKYNEPPKRKDMVCDSVTAILSGADLEDWQDKEIFEGYVAKIDVDEDVYKSFSKQELKFEDIAEIEYFKMYLDAFEADSNTTKYKGTKAFKNLSDDKKTDQLGIRFYQYAKNIEFEKLFYFALTYMQSTVIISAPNEDKKQKEFLGYKWSGRKGSEGIKIIKRGGKMYVDEDRRASSTLASAVRNSFIDGELDLSEDNRLYAGIVTTSGMLDFSRVTFNKSIRTSIKAKKHLQSKYPLHKLGKKCHVLIGGTPSRENYEYFTGSNLWVSIAEMQGQIITDTKEKITDDAIANSNVKLIPAGTTLLSFKLSIGKTAIAGVDLYTNEAIAGLIPIDRDELLDAYLFVLFSSKLIDLDNVGDKAFGKSLNSTYLKEEVYIPIPPIPVQKEIIAMCAKIDEEYNSTRMSIEEYRKKIETLFDELEVITKNSGGYKLTLSDKTSFAVSIGKRVLNSELVPEGTIPVFSANVFEPFGYVNKLLIEDFSMDSVLWGIDGDWMVNFYPKDNQFYPTDHCGVLRILTDKVHPRYMARILETEGKKMNFSRTYRASIDRVEGISFSVPSFEVQEKAMKQVVELEAKISELESGLASLDSKKAEILASFLN